MKRLQLISLSVLAIFLPGAVATAAASAEKAFLPTPELATLSGGVSALETAANNSLTCSKLDESHIEMESAKHGKATLHWLGCKAAGLFAANSLSDKSEEILVPVTFLVCLDPKDAEGKMLDEFGVALEFSKAHLEVPAVGTLLEVNGTALGMILTSGPAKLWTIEFLGKKGAQTARKCVEGTLEKLHNLTTEQNHNGKPEAASENVEGGDLLFEEVVEMMESPGSGAGFLPIPESAIISGGTSALETANSTIKCTKLDETHVEMESAKHGKATLRWLGCKAAGLFAANSLSDKSEEILVPVTFLVCLDPKDAEGKMLDEFGVALEFSKAHMEVPAVGTLLEVNGTALGMILTSGPAKLWTIEFLGKKGVQTARKCFEGTAEKEHNLTTEENHNGKPEAASENVEGGDLLFEESVKLMDKSS